MNRPFGSKTTLSEPIANGAPGTACNAPESESGRNRRRDVGVVAYTSVPAADAEETAVAVAPAAAGESEWPQPGAAATTVASASRMTTARRRRLAAMVFVLVARLPAERSSIAPHTSSSRATARGRG